jgi:hypothetical protein
MNKILQDVIDDCHAHQRDLTYQYLHPPFLHYRILTDYFSIIEKLLHQRLVLLSNRPPLVNYALIIDKTKGSVQFTFKAPVFKRIRNLNYTMTVEMKPSYALPAVAYPTTGMLSIKVGAIVVDGHPTPLAYADIAKMRLIFSDPTTVVSPGENTFAFYTSHLYGMCIMLPNSVKFYIDCLTCFPHQANSTLFKAFRDPVNEGMGVSRILSENKLEFEFENLIFTDLVYYLDKNRRGPPQFLDLDSGLLYTIPLSYRNIDELFATPAPGLLASIVPKSSLKSDAARAFVRDLLVKFLPFVQFCRFEKDNRLISVSTRRFDFSQQSNYNTLMYFATCPYHGMFVIRSRAQEMG